MIKVKIKFALQSSCMTFVSHNFSFLYLGVYLVGVVNAFYLFDGLNSELDYRFLLLRLA